MKYPIKITIFIFFLLSAVSLFAQQPKWEYMLDLGSKQFKEKNYTEAVKSYTECIKANAQADKCYNGRGKAYWTLGKKVEASADLEKAVKLNPKNKEAAADLTKMKEKKNDLFNDDIFLEDTFDFFDSIDFKDNEELSGKQNTASQSATDEQKKQKEKVISNQCVSGNCVNGKGKKVYENDDTYEGDFVNDKKEGQGTFTTLEVYTGQFANDKYNGKGKLESIFGDIYEGDFVDGKKQGQGTYTNPSFDADGNDVYTGRFANEVKNGKGKIKYANGDVYDGSFVDGKFEGQGTYTFKNGDYYTGEWKNFNRNGYGKEYIKAANTTRKGTWKDGVLVDSTLKTAKINTPKQAKTENEWKEICKPYWSKMYEALKKKDIDSAKKVYAEFNAETKDANNSIRVKVELNSLLNQLYLSGIPQLKEFVESELKRLKYTDKEKEDVKRDNSKGFYV